MIVERRGVADLSEDPANVRKHSERNVAAIVASLRRFGQQKPIVVDSNGVVRAGNGTLAAALALGWEDVAVVVSDLGDVDLTAYAIADNRTAELAEWDFARLGEVMQSLKEADVDGEDLGFSEDELAAFVAQDWSPVELPPAAEPSAEELSGQTPIAITFTAEQHASLTNAYEAAVADGFIGSLGDLIVESVAFVREDN